MNIAIHGEIAAKKAREHLGIASEWRGARQAITVTEKQWDNFLKGSY
jgi:hypothetical protein